MQGIVFVAYTDVLMVDCLVHMTQLIKLNYFLLRCWLQLMFFSESIPVIQPQKFPAGTYKHAF